MDCNLSKELKLQLEGMQKFKSYVNKIQLVRSELAMLESEVEALTKSLKKENKDVESLKKNGLHAFYLKVRGKYEESMDREVLEAANAKVKLENKQFEVEDANRRLRGLKEEQAKYSDCEANYRELYKRKMEELLSEENKTKIAILEIQRKCSESEHSKKELREAIFAGNNVLSKIEEVEDSLGEAEDWGTVDMFSDGWMSDMMKHSHLDDAKERLNEVQSLMGNFRTELADVNMSLDIRIDTDGFSKFADFFFDDFFSDWNMQNRIHDAQDSVDSAKQKVEAVIARLIQLETDENARLQAYENQIETIVNNAK